MYYWRTLSEKQREHVREHRRTQRYPKHSLPHFDRDGECQYLLSAACYEHAPVIGVTPSRMTEFEADLLKVCSELSSDIYAWCILPNHYHVLLRTELMKKLREQIGKLHGSTSFRWNGEDDRRGRTVWRNCFERAMRSSRHYFATFNYVLNNAAHHRYVDKWQEWPWSNASVYLQCVGIEEAARRWREYPVLDYGSKWDNF